MSLEGYHYTNRLSSHCAVFMAFVHKLASLVCVILIKKYTSLCHSCILIFLLCWTYWDIFVLIILPEMSSYYRIVSFWYLSINKLQVFRSGLVWKSVSCTYNVSCKS
jgi:hypothetical protein